MSELKGLETLREFLDKMMKDRIHKKVIFQGTTYWYNEVPMMGYANLSPLEHFTEDGRMIANPFGDISFALIHGDEIWRFGQVIGKKSELIDVKETE